MANRTEEEKRAFIAKNRGLGQLIRKLQSPSWNKTARFIRKTYKDGKLGLAIGPYHLRNLTTIDADDLITERLNHHQKVFESGKAISANGKHCLIGFYHRATLCGH